MARIPFAQVQGDTVSIGVPQLQSLDAAAATLGDREPALVAYLHAAAQSFRDDDWVRADRAWKAMDARNSRWFVRVAPRP